MDMPVAKEFIIDVVPLTRIPLTRNQSFSYLHAEKLSPGTLVSVPLFSRSIEGIVLKNRADFHRLGNIKLKKINAVLEENFLDEKQLQLAAFISEYYFAPLGIVLKSFVLKRVKSRKKTAASSASKKKNIRLTAEQQAAVNAIAKNLKPKTQKYLLFGPASSGKTEVYIHSMLKLQEQNENFQSLVLLPELTLTPQAIERYSEYFATQKIAVIHSKLPKGQLYAAWQRIKNGEAKIIIGSRMAVFAPFRNLGLIVVDEEQDMSFKQWDMNPRYDARTVAEKLADLFACPLVFGSATPRIEDYWRSENDHYRLLKLPRLSIPDAGLKLPDTKIELIDLKKERWTKNYSPISKKLQSEIAYALKNKLQTILFVNRQGMSAFSVCAGCKTVLKCPQCDRALIYDREGIHRCVHCRYKTSITPRCSKCGGITFSNVGLGTQKVEKEILSLFPGARVARADNLTMQAPHAQTELYASFKNREIDILIGTQMISKGWDLPSVALVGIIDGDNLLAFPDFSAAEKAFQNITQAAGRVGRLGAKFPGQVVIQTFYPELAFWKTLAAKNFLAFYQQEIKERAALKFPPFARLIKLVFQDYSAKKAGAEAQRVFEKLKSSSGQGMKVSEPQDAFLARIRGRYRRQILIKTGKAAPESLKNILRSLPSGWIIDIDPISII